jgi:hypothetical protein
MIEVFLSFSAPRSVATNAAGDSGEEDRRAGAVANRVNPGLTTFLARLKLHNFPETRITVFATEGSDVGTL